VVVGHHRRRCGEFARVSTKYVEMIAVNGLVMLQMRQQRTDKYSGMSRLFAVVLLRF
jgi:hypothetical protein